jgi:hypothetical protein
MHSTIWGWIAWRFMHLVSFTYPHKPTDLDKRMYQQFYRSVGEIIPCKVCRAHYRQRIHSTNIISVFRDRHTLTRWLVSLHNEVNIGLQKKSISYGDSVNIYEKLINDVPYYEIYKVIQIFINTVHTDYTRSEIASNINFYNSLAHILPNIDMKKQYNDALEQYPINSKTVYDKISITNWYNNIKPIFEKDLVTKNVKYIIKYVLRDNKTKQVHKKIFEPNLLNIKSLQDINYINHSSTIHSITHNIQLNDDIIITIKPFKKISNRLYIKKSVLISLVNYKIKILSKKVPKKMRH